MNKRLISIILSTAVAVSPVSTVFASSLGGNRTDPNSNITMSQDSGLVLTSDTTQSYSTKYFKLTITSSRPLQQSSVNTDNIHLRNLDIADDVTGDSAIRVKLEDNRKDITITLKEDLDQDTNYTLIVEGLKDENGNLLLTDSKTWDIRTSEQEDTAVDNIKPVTELKGTAISSTKIKWTWKYDKNDEKYIDGFKVYDSEGNLLTDENEINAKEREYEMDGLTPGKAYTISVTAFNSTSGDEEIESEEVKAAAKTSTLNMPQISEKNLFTKVQGKDIYWYWEYKSYKDFSDNYSDYYLRISKDTTFTKYVEVPLIKGKYIEKNAVTQKSSKNKIQITRYYQIVNKAYNKKSSISKKIIVVSQAVTVRVPQVTIGEINTEDNTAIVKIKDLSTNEVSFNLYWVDENGQRNFLSKVQSNSTTKTGQIYIVKVNGFEPEKFYGFIATAVDKSGYESKDSQMAKIVMDDSSSDDSSIEDY